jgi:hypothetical protein
VCVGVGVVGVGVGVVGIKALFLRRYSEGLQEQVNCVVCVCVSVCV